MYLFKCDTLFQLITFLNIKENILCNQDVDIIFSGETDFSNIINRVKAFGVFHKIFFWRNFTNRNIQSVLKENKNSAQAFTKISSLMGDKINYVEYDRLFFGSDIYSNQILYYMFLNNGNRLLITMIDEGLSSYISFESKKNSILTKIERKFRIKGNFYKARDQIFVYKPEYLLSNSELLVSALPPIKSENIIQQHLRLIFGKANIPKNPKFIFLEQCFLTQLRFCDDIQILDWIADRVGKENIVVKLHPRSQMDRFTKRGYTVWSEKTPIEAVFVNAEACNSILLSISSTAALTNYIVFSNKCISIWLDGLAEFCEIGVLRTKMNCFIDLLKSEINSNQPSLFVPRNYAELSEILDYVQL